MSWLYSIVFAGLLLSTNGGDAKTHEAGYSASGPQRLLFKRLDETEKFDQTYPLSATGRVALSNVNGSIVIEAWDRNEVKLEVTKTADSKETLADVEVRVDAKPDAIRIETDFGALGRRGGWNNGRKIEVQFRLMVPRGAVLNEIQTVNGSVTVSNFTNFTKVSAVNGNVVATNLRGTAQLSTVNGEVVADFERLDASGRINLTTVNGRVNVTLPSDVNATLKADSLNGNITNGFGLPVRKGKYIGRDLHGRIGSGEVQIKLNSVNGPLDISRKSDGKTPAPAVNLLQNNQDASGDWDDVDAEVSPVQRAKINQEIARAMKDSHRESAAAMKEAQIELERIRPEIAAAQLAKVNVQIDDAKIRESIREGMKVRTAALAQLDEIRWQGNPPIITKKSNTFRVKGTPKVSIDAKGCGVRVRGWDKPEVQYVLTEIAGRRDRTAVTVEETATESTVSIRVPDVAGGDSRRFDIIDPSRVRLEVLVPRQSNMTIASDGEIRLEGVTGNIELDGGDEPINIRDAGGDLRLTSVDGDVRVIGFNGILDTRTADGNVFLEGNFDKLSTRTGDGDVVLTVPVDANFSVISNTSVTGDGVDVKNAGGRVWQVGTGGKRYSFEFADGSLLVRSAAQLSSY